jgi:hypothetical protein
MNDVIGISQSKNIADVLELYYLYYGKNSHTYDEKLYTHQLNVFLSMV